jgi:hypothetical protein
LSWWSGRQGRGPRKIRPDAYSSSMTWMIVALVTPMRVARCSWVHCEKPVRLVSDSGRVPGSSGAISRRSSFTV